MLWVSYPFALLQVPVHGDLRGLEAGLLDGWMDGWMGGKREKN